MLGLRGEDEIMGGGFKHSIKGKRNKNDFYPTHHSMVWQLSERISIPEYYGIHDPACGENDIIKALKESGFKNEITGSDISTGDDFLIDNGVYDVIFTNPPFSIANIFLEKCFQVAKRAIILLLPLDYLHGKDRFDSFYKDQKEFYLQDIYCFVRRPMFTDSINEDGCYETGSVTFAWFVWIKTEKMSGKYPDPKFKWIDNNKYVIGARKKIIDKHQQELF